MRFLSFLSLLVGSFMLAAPAPAAVVLEQSPDFSFGANSNWTTRAYDDFRLAADTTITSVTWWALSLNATQSFGISFYGVDAGGIRPDVAAPLYSTTIDVTGENIGGYQYKYTAILPEAVTLAGNTNLFLSIGDFSDTFYYAWAASHNAPSPGSVGANSLLSYYNGAFVRGGSDVAFRLESDPVVAAPIPEVGTWLTMLLGFGAIGGAMRRRATPPSASARNLPSPTA